MCDIKYDTSAVTNRWAVLRALFGPTIILIILALTIPNDVFARFPLLIDTVHLVTNVIPAMRDYINNSTIPEVAAVFFTLAWISFPIHVGLLTFEFRRHDAYSRIASSITNAGRLGMWKPVIKTFVVALLCGYALLFLPNDPSFIGRLGMNSSRLGLALFGSGSFFIFSLSSSLFIYLLVTRIGHPNE